MNRSRALASAMNRRPNLLFYIWLGALTAFLVGVATIDLANFRPITGDGAWIFSASYKLATKGIFGSDLFAGFFNADRHYFIALPGQNLFQALFLRLFGSGIVQARWVSVVSGVTLLWVTSILARRWYGSQVAALASILLLFWQPGLVGEGSVPLVSLSRSMRYDLSTVAWIWLALLFFDSWLQQPTPARSFATGLASACAVLTQFFGAVILLVVAVGATTLRKKRAPSAAHLISWLIGFFILVGPYLFYVIAHWEDALGQTAYLKGGRANFGVQVLWSNVLREPERYLRLLEEIDVAPGPWILLLGIGPALFYVGKRLRQNGRHGDGVLALTLASTVLFLALIDNTKAPIYALPLLPGLCIAFALLTARLLEWASRERGFQGRVVLIAVPILFAMTILHGVHFYYRDWRAALSVTKYEAHGMVIDAAMAPGAAAAGPERWWWPLRQRKYLALNNMALQWMVWREQSGQTVSFASVMRENGIRYIIVDSLLRGSTEERTRALREHFSVFLEVCAVMQGEWMDKDYGDIRLYAIKPACS